MFRCMGYKGLILYLITTKHALTLVMFLNVANCAQTHKYVAFALRCFGQNIGWMNGSPTKSKTLSHPGNQFPEEGIDGVEGWHQI